MPSIEQKNEYEYVVQGLPRNESVWLQVGNFDVQLKRTDEGIVVEIFDFHDDQREESMASTYAYDSETILGAQD